MAVFQYGGLITRISGSIGGTNFRLFRNMPVISNKSYGGSRNKLLSNPRIFQLRWLFSQWRYLHPDDRTAWLNLAAAIKFPDKFGTLRYISGRELYIKFNSQLLPAAAYNSTPRGVVNIISPMRLDFLNIRQEFKELTVSVADVTERNHFLFQFETFRNFAPAPTFTRRVIIKSVREGAAFSVNLWEEVVANSGDLSLDNLVRIYVTPMSMAGNRGVTQIIEGQVSL